MPYKTTVPVNGDKLKLCLLKKGLRSSEVSREMGFAQNYLSDAARRGQMSGACAVMLENMYGIPLKDYKAELVMIPEEPEPEPEEHEAPTAFAWNPPIEFWTALYNHIFSAVYEAVKKAWSE